MHQKRKIQSWLSLLALLVVVILILPACAAPTTTGPTPAVAPEVKPSPKVLELKSSMYFPQDNVRSQGVKYWSDMVEQKTNGRIKAKWFYGASLVPVKEELGAAGRGVTDVSYLLLTYFGGVIPQYQVFDIPFLVNFKTSKDMLFEVFAPGSVMDRALEKQNVKFIFPQIYMAYQMISRKDFIKTPADLKGLKMRISSATVGSAAQVWGAAPVTLAMDQLYSALQTGVVDCTFNTFTAYESSHLYEVAPYVTEMWATYSFNIAAMNLDVWNGLSREDQEIIRTCARPANEYSEKLELDNEMKVKNMLPELKSKLYVLTPEELAAWRQPLKGLENDYLAKTGPEGQEIMNIIRKYQ